jgi:hypothetical protein
VFSRRCAGRAIYTRGGEEIFLNYRSCTKREEQKEQREEENDDDDDVVDKFGGVFSAPRLRVRPFGDAPMFISRAQLDVRSNAFEVREGALLEEEERELVASTDQFSRAHSNRELIDNDGSPGREGLS